MDENISNGKVKVFFKRILLILFILFVVLITCYLCSAINTVSNYRINLKESIGYAYENEEQSIVLIINSEERAYFNTDDDDSGIYLIDQRDNVLFLRKNEGDEDFLVFIPLSESEMFYQKKNMYLYRWE